MKATTVRFVFPVFVLIALVLWKPHPLAGLADTKEASRVITHILASDFLDSPRRIQVSLPRGYHSSGDHFPLLLVLDGDDYSAYVHGLVDLLCQSGAMPALIVVSVYSPDRWRDFTPTRAGIPGQTTIPTSGKAHTFLYFLKTELIPFLDSRYRTRPFRLLAGHSLSGLFATYAFVQAPNLFSACMVTSPSLWWDGEIVTRKLPMRLTPSPKRTRFLYMAVGGEGPTLEDPCQRFKKEMNRLSMQGVSFLFQKFPGRAHQEMPVWGFPDGLKHIFAGWRPPPDLFSRGLPKVQAHFSALSRRFGITVKIPEPILNRLGYFEMRRHHLDRAIQAFRLNVRLYPGASNVHDSLGDALARAGSLQEAIASYRTALKLAPGNERIRKRIQELVSQKGSGS